jgi:hypothetical protein
MVTGVDSSGITVTMPGGGEALFPIDVEGSIYYASLDSVWGSEDQPLAEQIMQHLYEMEEALWTLMGVTDKDLIYDETSEILTVKGARSRLTNLLGPHFSALDARLVAP